MPVPGYDIDDLDDNIRERLTEWAITQMLDDDELDRLAEGESLLDLLDEEDLERISGERDARA
jgi:hypothetical protein